MHWLLDEVPMKEMVSKTTSSFATDRWGFDPRELRDITVMVDDATELIWEQTEEIGNDWLIENLKSVSKEFESEGGELTETRNSGESAQQNIRASDRYVLLSDNQEKIVELLEGAEELSESLRGDNELDDNMRQIAIAEIAIFESCVGQPVVSIDIIERFLDFCVTRLAKSVGSIAQGYILKKLTPLIDDFLNAMG